MLSSEIFCNKCILIFRLVCFRASRSCTLLRIVHGVINLYLLNVCIYINISLILRHLKPDLEEEKTMRIYYQETFPQDRVSLS